MDDKLKSLIKSCQNIVFFGGAGVSTESGIPDFRSASGVYSSNSKYGYPPETMLSRGFFDRHAELFFDFYRENMIYLNALPNKAHIALAELEKEGKLKAIVTQNIDGLHQAAGSKNIIELHGSVRRNFCMRCGKFHSVDAVVGCGSVPKCECGGIIKPDVVLYEEPLNSAAIETAVDYISKAEMLIIGGTSLSVYPAAGLCDYFKGKHLVLINKTATSADGRADLVYHNSLSEVL